MRTSITKLAFAVGTFAACIAVGGAASADQSQSGISVGAINQRSINRGDVLTLGIIAARSISGDGVSASISATGAVNSIAVTSINATQRTTIGGGRSTSVSQTAYNSGDVVTAGAIIAGRVSGPGASVSISSVGAASGISVMTIGGGRR